MFHVNPEPGGRIHSTDPFATPDQDKSPIRRLRGRLAAPVTLWTAPGPAGLTVSSMVVADGDPGRVLGLVDEESDFFDAVRAAKRFAVTPLGPGDQQLADKFAGLMPAPGGLFASGDWVDTSFGPVPARAGTWAGCLFDAERPYGWAMLVEATIESVVFGDAAGPEPLLHFRGRYRRLDR
ncbi:flavin reductase (DIM6/NTAB) family NADH-FMN oxidoreductase RutF [Couchioplanes caeruleus]|uniref:Flavin reductase n=2 Tax=Couchioplanes caeruleus TaxID=56438 RepID=A0A1K0FM56_9ACTN|nr:flavin reductase family protein [Couchioplanes caeruleus]OJF13816.1 flavin reductase [Couchioplanes caeruleus subsp. caeruleus]ROP31201.1 flavin reductase (DIM6/NTAB) family NADH-FMN oxidoreductase RutF [Couchioplanes caeruleus]